MLGGIDVMLHPRAAAFISGRIGGWNAIEEAAISAGIRAALVPDRAHRAGTSGSALKGTASGEKIWIVRDDGMEVTGTLVGASASEITLRTGGRIASTPMSSIRRIYAPDSPIEGAVIGGLSGLGAGLLLAYYDEPRTVPASILIGAGVGAVLDALGSKRRLVYMNTSAVALAPVITRQGAGLGMNIIWR